MVGSLVFISGIMYVFDAILSSVYVTVYVNTPMWIYVYVATKHHNYTEHHILNSLKVINSLSIKFVFI